jgi:glycosyltransferase involved in cell wall biosynthesis
MSSQPFFSVVIPVFNRPCEIQRALKSCLAQEHKGFEIVVVDDGSTDGTLAAIRQWADKRVTIVSHSGNRGVCAARNTGVRNARGEWMVFLDSDDELLPGALDLMAQRIRETSSTIQRLFFCYAYPDGGQSAAPVVEEVLDYARYLSWAEQIPRSDFLNCVRRSTFHVVTWPESRAYERIYHLNFARTFPTRVFRDVVSRVHYDAANRLTKVSFFDYIRKQKVEALDGAKALDEIVASHGAALRRFAPRTFRSLLRQRFEMYFLAGETFHGLRRTREFLRAYPLSATAWAALAAGMLGPSTLGALKFLRVKSLAHASTPSENRAIETDSGVVGQTPWSARVPLDPHSRVNLT